MQLTGTLPIFEEVAQYFEKLIRLGVYPVGSYLPSVRETALQSQINPNTVQKGYSLLAEKKFVISIPKKGYQVIRLEKDNSKNIIKESIFELMKQGFSLSEIKEVIQELEEKAND